MTEGHRTFAEINISNSQAPGDRPPPPKCHMKEKRTPRYQVCVNEKQKKHTTGIRYDSDSSSRVRLLKGQVVPNTVPLIFPLPCGTE